MQQKQEVQDFQELARFEKFTAVDLTTPPYSLGPGIGSTGINFDPSRNYGALSLVKGRVTPVITGPLTEEVYSIGLFITENPSQVRTNYCISFSSLGFGKVLIQGYPAKGNDPLVNLSYAAPAGATITGTSAQFQTMMDYMFVTTNGAGATNQLGSNLGDPPLKLWKNDTAFTGWQVPPPLLAPIPTVVGAINTGNLNGYYYWRCTYLNTQTAINCSVVQESSPGPIYVTAEFPSPYYCNNQNVTLDLTPLSTYSSTPNGFDPQCNVIGIYRLGGTSSTWLLIGVVPINTQSFTDNFPDGTITGNSLVSHADPPPNFRAITVHKSRMWGFGYDYSYYYNYTSNNTFATTTPQPCALWYSLENQPWAFDNVNQVFNLDAQVDGDTAVGLFSVGSVLACLKENSFWAVFGDNEDDFYPIKLFEVGCIGQDTIAGWGGLVFWVSNAGVYMSDMQTHHNISTGGDQNVQGSPQQLLLELIQTKGTNFVGFCMPETYYIYETTTNQGFGFYIPKMAWFQVKFLSAPEIYMNSPDNGLMYTVISGSTLDQWFASDFDYAGELVLTWVTGDTCSNEPRYTKHYAYVVMVMANGNPNDTVEVGIYVDGNLVTTVPLHPRSSGSYYYRIGIPIGTIGTSIYFKIVATQTSETPIVINSLSVYGSIEESLPPLLDSTGST